MKFEDYVGYGPEKGWQISEDHMVRVIGKDTVAEVCVLASAVQFTPPRLTAATIG